MPSLPSTEGPSQQGSSSYKEPLRVIVVNGKKFHRLMSANQFIQKLKFIRHKFERVCRQRWTKSERIIDVPCI